MPFRRLALLVLFAGNDEAVDDPAVSTPAIRASYRLVRMLSRMQTTTRGVRAPRPQI
jgi:hypothetical protein